MKYMRRRGLRMFAVAALLPMMAIAQAPNRAAGDEDPSAAQVTQLVRDLVADIPKRDAKVPRDFFADEAIITGFWGEVSGKLDFMRTFEGIHGHGNPEDSHEVNDFTVHTYGGEVAIVNCLVVFHTVARSIQGNTPARQDDRTTITFLKREGKWRAVAVQYTDVPHSQTTIQNFVPQMNVLDPAPEAAADHQDPVTADQVTQLVREFLANVPRNDPEVFKQFFADDVIYTRATGLTVTKADILKNIGVRATSTPEATFAADNFIVRTYGDMAVVNFRLIGHNVEKGKPTTYFRNTGTFLKRNGKWQAVAWQASKVPESSK